MLVSSYLISLPLITNADTATARQAVLGWLPVLFSSIGFTVLFFGVPNCRVRFRDALVGGLLTTLFFEAAKRLFTTIVANSNMQLVYGTFAAVPLFLTWLYLVWVLILSGAIVVRTLGIERDDAVSDGAPMLVQCIRLLAFLRRAHLGGQAITRTDLNDAVKLSGAERDEVLAVLGEFKLITSGSGNQLLLARDLRGVSLLELYRRLPNGLEPEKLANVHDMPRLIEPLLDHARYGAAHRHRSRFDSQRRRRDAYMKVAHPVLLMLTLFMGSCAPVDFEYADGTAGVIPIGAAIGCSSTIGRSGARRVGTKFRSSTHSTRANRPTTCA